MPKLLKHALAIRQKRESRQRNISQSKLTLERKGTSSSLNPASIPYAQSDTMTSEAADCHFNKKATSSTSINKLLPLCPIKNLGLPVSNYVSRRHSSCGTSTALERRHRRDACLSPDATLLAGRSTIKRAAHMIRTATVSVCVVSDGRTSPSARYIHDACRGVSASACTGATIMTARSGSKEGNLITSNDQTRSCIGISSNWTTSRAGVSTSTCAGATSSTRTKREGVSCVRASTHRSNGAPRSHTGVSMSGRAGVMSSARTGKEGVSCVSMITHTSKRMARSCAGISVSTQAGAMSCTGTEREVISCVSTSAHTIDGTTT
jgi:hypothetical protein